MPVVDLSGWQQEIHHLGSMQHQLLTLVINVEYLLKHDPKHLLQHV